MRYRRVLFQHYCLRACRGFLALLGASYGRAARDLGMGGMLQNGEGKCRSREEETWRRWNILTCSSADIAQRCGSFNRSYKIAVEYHENSLCT